MAAEQSAYGKPLPLMRGYTKEFYDFCKNRELRFQRCFELRRLAAYAAADVRRLPIAEKRVGEGQPARARSIHGP